MRPSSIDTLTTFFTVAGIVDQDRILAERIADEGKMSGKTWQK